MVRHTPPALTGAAAAATPPAFPTHRIEDNAGPITNSEVLSILEERGCGSADSGALPSEVEVRRPFKFRTLPCPPS